jgi:uncharacterized protein (TIGR02466 family)
MITDIFKTSIYHTNVSNIAYKDYFINVLEKCMEEKKETIKSNNGGFQTSVLRFNNCNEIEKKLINDLIIYPCTDFLKQFNIKKPFKLDNLYYWINKNFKGSSNKPHSHGYDCVSGVYYLNTPKNSGDLVFLDINKINCNTYKFFDDANFFSEFTVRPKQYDLILFFSEVIHYVLPNNSDEERISMAFNINIKDL